MKNKLKFAINQSLNSIMSLFRELNNKKMKLKNYENLKRNKLIRIQYNKDTFWNNKIIVLSTKEINKDTNKYLRTYHLYKLRLNSEENKILCKTLY